MSCLCKISTGNKNTQDKEDDGLYPFYVRSPKVERINSYTFDGEAILTAGDGVGVGKVFHYSPGGKIGIHQRVYLLSNFVCDSKFLYYIFSSQFYNRVKKMSAKNSVDSVRMEMIADMPLFIAPEHEQKRIGDLLSIIDERIATQNKIINNLQTLIKGLNDKFHDKVQGEFVSFSEIGTAYSGLSGKSGDDFGQGSPFITYLNVYQNNIINEDDFGLVTIAANECQHTISYGDVLFTLSSETPEEVGIGSVFLGESDKFYLNSFCFGVSIPNKDRIYPPYLAYLVSSTKFRKFVYPLAQGSTRFNLHKNDFMNKKFILPLIEEQRTIATTLDAIYAQLTNEQRLKDLYMTEKGYLLGQMFI